MHSSASDIEAKSSICCRWAEELFCFSNESNLEDFSGRNSHIAKIHLMALYAIMATLFLAGLKIALSCHQ